MTTINEGFKEIIEGFLVDTAILVFYKFIFNYFNLDPSIIQFLSFIGFIGTLYSLDELEFWTFRRTLGWFLGLIFVGPFFLSPPEWAISVIITILYLLSKLFRRTRSH